MAPEAVALWAHAGHLLEVLPVQCLVAPQLLPRHVLWGCSVSFSTSGSGGSGLCMCGGGGMCRKVAWLSSFVGHFMVPQALAVSSVPHLAPTA